MTAPIVLEDLRQDDQAFPHDKLVGCHTALVVFAGAFLGRQDAFWIADAGLTATCVDIDEDYLDAMWMLYPEGWEFVCMDAYEFARETERQWDIVTLDPWTNQFTKCADNLPAWCRLARHAVIVGTGAETLVRAPAGWRVDRRVRRSDYDGGVFWTVLEPA